MAKRTKNTPNWTAVIAALVALLLLAYVIASCALGTFDVTKWGKTTEPTDQTQPDENGGVVVTPDEPDDDTTTAGMPVLRITAQKLSSMADGIPSAQSEDSFLLTTTITPADATIQEVDWSIAFKNSSSTWATGKTVTNYATVTPTADGALTATVACLQPFGEQIVVTCTSRDVAAGSPSASCTLDYAKTITGAGFDWTADYADIDSETNLSYNAPGATCSVDYYTNFKGDTMRAGVSNITYGIGTINDTFTNYEFTVAVNPEYAASISSDLGTSLNNFAVDYNSDVSISAMVSKIFGSEYSYGNNANRSKLYNVLQPYYTNNQSVFVVTMTIHLDHRGDVSFNYKMKVNWTGIYVKVSGMNMTENFIF